MKTNKHRVSDILSLKQNIRKRIYAEVQRKSFIIIPKFKVLMKQEVLKGLSIEELEERAEFTAVISSEADLSAYSAEEIAAAQDGNCTCVICRC